MTLWKPKLQFIHRVLILISVPLLFQAIFIVILETQVNQERARQKQLIRHLKSTQIEVPAALQENSLGAQNRIQHLLAIGVTANVILCVLLVLYLSQNMVKRLGILMANSQRLAEGKDLSPPLSGNDEIARLDRVFHTMADTLEESRQREQSMLKSVQENELRLRQLMENLPVGLLSLTMDGKIDFANTALQRIFGHEQSELFGKPLTILFPGEAPETWQASQPDQIPRTLQAVTRDGSVIFVDILCTRFATDEQTRTLLSLQDVSAREHAERLKKEFLNMISHDLRTPLNAVQATLANLTEGIYGELPEAGRHRSEQAEKDVKRLIGLTSDLLELERLKAGKLPLRMQPVAVRHLIDRSLDAVTSFAELAEVTVQINGHASGTEPAITDGSTVVVDEERIVQVIVNLLTNAIKFSEKNGRVGLSTELQTGHLKVNIADAGAGIASESLRLIFEPFQQLGSSPDLKGSGLGLAICKSIVAQHGGEIGVTSEVGRGSTFWFTIPTGEV